MKDIKYILDYFQLVYKYSNLRISYSFFPLGSFYFTHLNNVLAYYPGKGTVAMHNLLDTLVHLLDV